MKISRRQYRKSRCARIGASAVEFAMIAPLMLTFTFALVELGRLMLVKQTATHATREGARVAVRPLADSDEVVQRVNEELSLMGIEGATVEVVPALVQNAEPGTQVTVRVTVDIASVSWVPGYFDFSVGDIEAETSMRRESTN